jgi:ABC-2 type transport system permease protein
MVYGSKFIMCMRRYLRIFLLYLENVFQYRSQIFVWFLISVLHPFIYLLFWTGASFGNMSGSEITSYYLLFIVAAGLLYVHVEVDAIEDIQYGNIATYLLKPLPYIVFKFMSELPWRLVQGLYGLAVLLLIKVFFPGLLQVTQSVPQAIAAAGIVICGYFVMYFFKMIVLISAVWFTDIGALLQFFEITIIIFAGFIMPIHFFPDWARDIVLKTPFPYAIYYPVTAVAGQLTVTESLRVLGMQLFWIFGLYSLYSHIWKKSKPVLESVGQ